jgi:ATP-dependent helicase HepA
MLQAAKDVASRASGAPTETAIALAQQTLEAQISRLKDLSSRNPHIPESEIKTLRATLKETTEALSQARLRLDSLRLIYCS